MPANAKQPGPEPHTRGWFSWSAVFGTISIILLAFVCYIPSFSGGFMWEDSHVLFSNPLIKKGVKDGLGAFWFSRQNIDYFPLTSTSLWFEWRLFGMNATWYRVINVLLHALSSVLIWRIFKKLKVSGAWLIGAVFAVHPVAVGSVAWIAERKNTLAMFFYALTFLCYLGYEDTVVEKGASRRRWYFLSFILFLAALFSNTHAVVLAPVLLLIAWWRRGRISVADVVRTVPFFAVALVMGLVTVSFQYGSAIGNTVVRPEGPLSRLAAVGWSEWFYLYKSLAPVDLMVVYPRWSVESSNVIHWLPLAALIVSVVVLSVISKRWTRCAAAGLGYHFIAVLPVIGFFDILFMRFSLVADHWHYFAFVGPVALLVGSVAWLSGRYGKLGRNAGRFAAVILLAVLCSLSWRQSSLHNDEKELWLHNIERNPSAWLAYYNLGMLYPAGSDVSIYFLREAAVRNRSYYEAYYSLGGGLRERGDLSAAAQSYLSAVIIKPDFAQARNALGFTYMMQRRYSDAIPHLQEAVRISGGYRDALLNLGTCLVLTGQHKDGWEYLDRATVLGMAAARVQSHLGAAWYDMGDDFQAKVHFAKAVDMANDAKAHVGLGMLMVREGDYRSAIKHYNEAMRVEPQFTEAHYHYAELLMALGYYMEAAESYIKVLSLNINLADAHYKLGNAFIGMGRLDKAIAQYERTIKSFPNLMDARCNLAAAFARKDRLAEAEAQFRYVIEHAGAMTRAHVGLGTVLRAQRRTDEAMASYAAALKQTPDNIEALIGLAAILALHPEPKKRDAVRAVELAETAERLTAGSDVSVLDMLAVTYEQAGRADDAEATTRKALEVAERLGRGEETIKKLEAQLRRYAEPE